LKKRSKKLLSIAGNTQLILLANSIDARRKSFLFLFFKKEEFPFLLSWRDHVDPRKISAIPPRIAGQKRKTLRRRLRTNEQVGQQGKARSAGTPISFECFAGQE
jgi:hypothetical protein